MDPAVSPLLPDLLTACGEAVAGAREIQAAARRSVGRLVAPKGRIDAGRLEAEQFAAHGFAWLATYVEALVRMLAWAERLERAGNLGQVERLLLQCAFGEYLSQIRGGMAMSQSEVVRLADLGLETADSQALHGPRADLLARQGN